MTAPSKLSVHVWQIQVWSSLLFFNRPRFWCLEQAKIQRSWHRAQCHLKQANAHRNCRLGCQTTTNEKYTCCFHCANSQKSCLLHHQPTFPKSEPQTAAWFRSGSMTLFSKCWSVPTESLQSRIHFETCDNAPWIAWVWVWYMWGIWMKICPLSMVMHICRP